MADLITFTVPGTPVAKARARSVLRHGKITHYTPNTTARYENLVRLAAQQAMGGQSPLEGAVSLSVRAYLPVPASWSKPRRLAASAGLPHTSRPDLDNLLKSVKDGANGVLWRDDSQVAEVSACKRYGDPRVVVEVRSMQLPNESVSQDDR